MGGNIRKQNMNMQMIRDARASKLNFVSLTITAQALCIHIVSLHFERGGDRRRGKPTQTTSIGGSRGGCGCGCRRLGRRCRLGRNRYGQVPKEPGGQRSRRPRWLRQIQYERRLLRGRREPAGGRVRAIRWRLRHSDRFRTGCGCVRGCHGRNASVDFSVGLFGKGNHFLERMLKLMGQRRRGREW
jgi:hypothetical protein